MPAKPFIVDDVYLAAYALCNGANLDDAREVERNGRGWFVFELSGADFGRILEDWKQRETQVGTRAFVSNLKYLREQMASKRRQVA